MLNDLLGFIYVLENKEDGKIYVGRKQFWSKRGKYWIESDWRTYYSSSNVVHGIVEECGEDAFHRRIVGVFTSKSALRYAEASAIIRSGAYIEPDGGYNGEFAGCKGRLAFTDQDLKQLKGLESTCDNLRC